MSTPAAIKDILRAIKPKLWGYVALAICVMVISYATVLQGIPVGIAIALSPFLLILLVAILNNPFWGFTVLMIITYLLIPMIRYSRQEGLSVIVDITLILIIISIALNKILRPTSDKSGINYRLVIISLIWLAFCALEILNPSALPKAWVLSRGLIYYFFLMSTLTFLVFKKVDYLRYILFILSILTLIGAAKGLMQQTIGFDSSEQFFLDSGAYKTHLLSSGTRYFSIYASAGIFGAAMAHAGVLYSIVALYSQKKWEKIYYAIVALAGFYGMIISGTRGALAIPIAGFFLFILLSKKIKIILPSIVLFGGVLLFLTMTTIGQSNAYIRRMRSAFDPEEPSLMVRKENQKILGAYLKNKPFGEGLGLSGVDVQNIPERFTTSIPTDSWYVKIWVETGIIGLCLHIAILLYIIIYGCIVVFVKIKDQWLKGILTALLCSMFGILISSYGNQILGQFPIVLIIYMSMSLIFMGPYFDKQITNKRELIPTINN